MQALDSGLKSTVAQAQASARAQNSMDPVKLIASDGSEIILDRRAAMVSGTIKSMLSGPGESSPSRHPPARCKSPPCSTALPTGDAQQFARGPVKAERVSARALPPARSLACSSCSTSHRRLRPPAPAPLPPHCTARRGKPRLRVDARLPPAGQFTESQQGEVKFPEINAKILEKTVQYFYYKLRHTNHVGPLPEFKIEPEAALELLMAANFLDT